MTVMIPVYMQVELDDATADDPLPGSILEGRLLSCAEEAVKRALIETGDNVGFEHALARVASVGFLGTDTPRRMDTAIARAPLGSPP